MAPAEVKSAPYARIEDNLTWWALGRDHCRASADTNWQLGLSAVLEEKDGTKSYWALAHARPTSRTSTDLRVTSPRGSP